MRAKGRAAERASVAVAVVVTLQTVSTSCQYTAATMEAEGAEATALNAGRGCTRCNLVAAAAGRGWEAAAEAAARAALARAPAETVAAAGGARE